MTSNQKLDAKKVAAFFDVDNTLVRGSTPILFGKVAFRGGNIKRRVIWRFAFEQMMFVRRGEKTNSLQEIKDRALSVTKGYQVKDLEPLLKKVYESEIKPRLWPETGGRAARGFSPRKNSRQIYHDRVL